MAGRKADPFNFDDIYKQAGVEDLFVKKTMGELKQRQATTGTTAVAASQPCKQHIYNTSIELVGVRLDVIWAQLPSSPQCAATMGAPTARPAVQAQKGHAGAFDLDFLSKFVVLQSVMHRLICVPCMSPKP